MSEDVFQFCITGKIKDGYLTEKEYQDLLLDLEEFNIFKLPDSVESDENQLVYFDYDWCKDKLLDRFLLHVDYKGNTGIVYYFANDYPYEVDFQTISITDFNSTVYLMNQMGVDEIKVHAFTYYSGSDNPMTF